MEYNRANLIPEFQKWLDENGDSNLRFLWAYLLENFRDQMPMLRCGKHTQHEDG